MSKGLPGLSGLFQKVMEFRKKDLGNLRYVGQVGGNCGSPGPITSVFHDKQYGGSESLICRILVSRKVMSAFI